MATEENEAYEGDDPIELLREINSDIANIPQESPGDRYRLGFLEGRALEITRGMAEHPEWWERGCYCTSCREDF